MILADKIINLRKQNEWSQEEFALKMGVSRQAVSKWESAQTTPDLQKILQMAKLFGVSTDYLLKDEVEVCENINEDSLSGLRKVSLEEVNEILRVNETTAKDISYGVLLCIVSCIPLLLLIGLSKDQVIGGSVAVVAGVALLLALVAMAVVIFVVAGNKRNFFDYLDKEDFEAGYGVEGLVKEREKAYKNTYTKFTAIGVVLCVLAAIPVVCITLLSDEPNEDGFKAMILVSLTIAIVAIGVFNLVRVNTINGIFKMLLQEGDYSSEKKALRKNKTVQNIESILWTITIALYLLISFLTNKWNITWVIFPVVAVLSGLVPIIYSMAKNK